MERWTNGQNRKESDRYRKKERLRGLGKEMRVYVCDIEGVIKCPRLNHV